MFVPYELESILDVKDTPIQYEVYPIYLVKYKDRLEDCATWERASTIQEMLLNIYTL